MYKKFTKGLNQMKNISLALTAMVVTGGLAGCTGVYQDSIQPPSKQEISEFKQLEPRNVLKRGIFHMQKTGNHSTVRVEPEIMLKKPNLPPFDVAYVREPVEDIIIELANTAGESVVIPESIRGKTITVIHAGSNFKAMMDIVLSKVGYHYNYVDGVWYVTKFPVKNYQLEVSQALREGSLQTELEPERLQSDADTVSTSEDAEELTTTYEDELWDQVEDTVEDLITVGDDGASQDDNRGGQDLSQQQNNRQQGGRGQSSDGNQFTGNASLVSPEVGFSDSRSDNNDDELTSVEGRSFLAASGQATPFFRITRGAGLITVRASPEAHRMIEDYLEQIQNSLLRQVFVDARILAIVKNRQASRGTDISAQGPDGDGVSLGDIGGKRATGSFGFDGSPRINLDGGGDNLGGFLNFSFNNNSIEAVIQMLNRVGDVHTISSPSLLARNNQISRVAITQQIGFAETTVETSVNADGDTQIGQRTDEARFRNAGTIFSVMPFVGKNKVQMRMRLSLSSQSGSIDINTSIGTDGTVSNSVPEISTNLIDQDMVMDYGRVHAVGGIVQSTTDMNESYVPGFNQVPGLRQAFSSAANQETNTEFVVLMRVSRS